MMDVDITVDLLQYQQQRQTDRCNALWRGRWTKFGDASEGGVAVAVAVLWW